MSDTFSMKLVIDEVTTPLLHAELAAVFSPRKRAAMLRSLAESALRNAAGLSTAVPVATRGEPGSAHEWATAHPSAIATATPLETEATSAATPERNSSRSNERQDFDFDPDAIAEQLADYF
jgi:hypothetical protein